MLKANQGKLHSFEFTPPIATSIPAGIIDDVGLADRLAIQRKTLWWLIKTNTLDNQRQRDRALYKHIRIPKSNGKFRDIHEPHEVLKNVQKALLVTFFAQHTAPVHVSAYIKGRRITECAQQHVGKAVKISMDIKNFFPSITKRTVYDHLVTEMEFAPYVAKLLVKLVTVPLPRRGDPTKAVYVLPQGAPTSAALSNRIAMTLLDGPVLAYLEGKGATYTRYCDNLEVSFDEALSREAVDAHITVLTQLVEKASWHINRSKTSIQRRTSPNIPMRVLGMNTRDKLGAPKATYKRLRVTVHIITTHGVDEQFMRSPLATKYNAQSAEDYYVCVRGELQYWAQVNPTRFQPLLDKLNNYWNSP